MFCWETENKETLVNPFLKKLKDIESNMKTNFAQTKVMSFVRTLPNEVRTKVAVQLGQLPLVLEVTSSH